MVPFACALLVPQSSLCWCPCAPLCVLPSSFPWRSPLSSTMAPIFLRPSPRGMTANPPLLQELPHPELASMLPRKLLPSGTDAPSLRPISPPWRKIPLKLPPRMMTPPSGASDATSLNTAGCVMGIPPPPSLRRPHHGNSPLPTRPCSIKVQTMPTHSMQKGRSIPITRARVSLFLFKGSLVVKAFKLDD